MNSSEDIDQLRLLSIFHYVVAGVLALFSIFPVIHLVMGILMVTGQFDDGNPPPAMFGWMFVIMASIMILCGLVLSVFVAIAGRQLGNHTGYTFCLVVAGVECLFFPFGTVLGVLTILVLLRPRVKELFGVAEAP